MTGPNLTGPAMTAPPPLPRAQFTALILAIFCAWLPALRAPFTYDDRIEVVGNRSIRLLGNVDAILTYNTSRPFLVATYALNWWLGGLDPLGYHLLSLAIHAINAWLAWRLAARLLSPDRALLASALWALHPMTTEAVTYVTGRSDALEATAWLVALTAWIDHRAGRPHMRAVAVAATVVAMGTKEVGLLLPVVLLSVDRWIAPRPRWRDHLPFLAIGIAAVSLRLTMYGWPQPEVPRGSLTQLISQAEVWARLLALWLRPAGQSILHDVPAHVGVAGVVALLGWVCGFTWIFLRARAPSRRPLAALVAFAATLWAAWLVPASAFPLVETMAEHRAYLAGYAVILVFVATVPRPRLLWALAPVLLLATAARNRVWADEASLWGEAAARNPDSARAWYGYGEALRLAHAWGDAAPAYLRVLELEPGHIDARIDLGIVRAESGDPAGARAAWEEARSLDPKACAAHNNLAALDFRADRLTAAETGYASALAWCNDDPIPHLNLANIAWRRADLRKAAFHYREYLRVAGNGPAAPLARQRLAEMNAAP